LLTDDLHIVPQITNGDFLGLGNISVGRTLLRNPATRFMPWIDSYEGEIFRRFKHLKTEKSDGQTRIELRALSDPDTVFRERRDSSGDPTFRNANWDADPKEASVTVVIEPASEVIDGRSFTGFRYWYEYESADVPIHRILDRQTWEVGGNLDDVNLVCRNWLTPPRMKIEPSTTYSSVGLNEWVGLLPGNMWGRWSLLPGFDMQYGKSGILIGKFDRVSLIRTVIESNAGEDCIRYLDLHYFEQSLKASTNPKTILFCPDVLDHTDALNLWTRLQDQDSKMSRDAFGIKEEEPPAIGIFENHWVDFKFETSYENLLAVGEELGVDYVFIDPVWEHDEAMRQTVVSLIPEAERDENILLKKYMWSNMCATYDFEVAKILGGEDELKALCDRAAKKGLKVLTWMAAHYHPHTMLQRDAKLKGAGKAGIYAAKESGAHPDTGYPAHCWPVNLNGPMLEKIRGQILGVCERTGLKGFLWDSFCNLGWWQIDYSNGSMRPQYDRMGELYASLSNAGLYILPEAIVSFSNHSCCGLHGGNVYEGDLIGYSYNTSIHLPPDATGVMGDLRMIKGEEPVETLFRCMAHRRVPNMELQKVPREQWDTQSVAQMKRLFASYKKVRHAMQHRTVLKNDVGVLWEVSTGAGEKWLPTERILYPFSAAKLIESGAVEVGTDTRLSAGDRVNPGFIYRLDALTKIAI